MFTTNLRKVGGSIMLAVPPALLNLLNLSVGAEVSLGVEDGRLIVEAKTPPRYTLDELLSQCGEVEGRSVEDEAWINAAPIGAELI